MKVVFIGTVASSILGFRASLIKEVLAEGHEVFALAIDYTDEQKEIVRSWGAVPVDYDLSRSGLNPLSDIKTVYYLKKELEKITPDIVFSYFVKPVIYGTIAAKLSKVPQRIGMLEGLGFVFTSQPHRMPLKTMIIRWVILRLFRISFPHLTQLVFLNNDDKNELLNDYRLKVKSVSVLGGIGVDLTTFKYSPPSNNKVSFLFIGRLLREKGVYEFLHAAKAIKERYNNDVEFVVVGQQDSTSPNALTKHELDAYIDSGVIDYPGQVSNVYSWIEASSVLVLPSYREGMPMCVQESMAVGRPVIVSDVPGCRDSVIDSSNGFLVPVFSVEKLIEKMAWFVEHPESIETMGKSGRNFAEKEYDVIKVNTKLLALMGLNK